MQIVPIHHQHAKNRRPWILLPVVSGPWTSFVAAIDKGRSNIAVCRRYTAPIQNSSGKVWRPVTIWAWQNLQLRGDMQQITAHSNSYSSLSLSFCPLCIRRGFDKSFARGRAEQMLKVMNSVSRTSLAIIISLRDVPVLSYNDMFFSQRAVPSPSQFGASFSVSYHTFYRQHLRGGKESRPQQHTWNSELFVLSRSKKLLHLVYIFNIL